jgi:hypothetical protein
VDAASEGALPTNHSAVVPPPQALISSAASPDASIFANRLAPISLTIRI